MTAPPRKRGTRAAPTEAAREVAATAPDETRRMMRERIDYLFGVVRARWAVHPRPDHAVEDAALTSTPEAVTELACERLAHAVRVVAPRYARALLRDETLVWRFPLRATFARSPLDASAREDEHLSASLYGDPDPRNRVLWCIGHMNASGYLPADFPVDPRAAYEAEGRTEQQRAMRARNAADGVRMVEGWSSAWPPGVEVSRVCELLRATKAPDAAAVADAIRGVVFGGPDVMARLGARPGPVETAEQRTAGRRALVSRWADAFTADGFVVPLVGDDAKVAPPSMVSRGATLWGESVFVRADVVARNLDAAPWWLVDATADCIVHHLRGRWSPGAVAHIADAIDRVDAGQRAARHIPLPARRDARRPFEGMARAESFAGMDVALVVHAPKYSIAAKRVVTWRVVWDGRPSPQQEVFAWAAPADTPDAFRDILRKLGAEGLRDYVILHRMAAEQGRTGRFWWTWEAHRRATALEARVRRSTMSDAEAKAATLRRIDALCAAELHVEAYDQATGRRAWKVVGEAPLVSAVGGVDRGRDVEVREYVLNSTLYRGARAGEGVDARPYFTQLPEAVLSLPALAFSLGVMLAFQFRRAVDDGGVVEIPKKRLHELMGDSRGRRGYSSADDTLTRTLGAAAKAYGDGFRVDDAGDNLRVSASKAWVHAVVDRVPPSLPASTATNPRTGTELRAWREARKLSQADAAVALGVSKRTIVRAEIAGDKRLPRAFQRATWGSPGLTPPPVEGGR